MTGTASPTSLRFDAPVRNQSGEACSAPGVRITRRGRAVLLVVLVALLLAAFTLGRTGDSQAATDAPTRSPYATTTVHEGESREHELPLAAKLPASRETAQQGAKRAEQHDFSTHAGEGGRHLRLPISQARRNEDE